MNSLADIASVLSEDVSQLPHGQWVSIPLDEHRELRLLRAADQSGVTAVLAQHSAPRSEAEEEEAFMALLRLGADSRLTEGWAGGIDEDGRDCISLVFDDLTDPEHVEATLQRVMERLAVISSHVRPAGAAQWTWGLA